MYPKLLELGPINIYTYGVLLAAAYLIGLQFAVSRARARGLDGNRVMDLGILSSSARSSARSCCSSSSSGNTSRATRRSSGRSCARAASSTAVSYWRCSPLSGTSGATSCRSGPRATPSRPGSCSVRPWGGSAVWWPAVVTASRPICRGASRSPTRSPPQTSARRSTSACTRHSSTSRSRHWRVLGFLLVYEKRGNAFPGRTLWAYLLLYPTARFFIEFYRGDPRGTVFEVLSTSQFVSALLIPTSIVMLIVLGRRGGTPEPTVTAAQAHAA